MPRKSAIKCFFKCRTEGPFHQFPKPVYPSIDRFNEWKMELGELLLAKDDNYIYNNIRLCNLHFEPFYHTAGNRLTRNAVPSLNICVRKSTMTTTKEPSATAQIPSVSTQEPSVTTQEPSVTTQEPSVTTQLSVTTQKPSVATQKPSVTALQPFITNKEPSPATIVKPPALNRRFDYVDKGVPTVQRLPFEIDLHKEHSLQMPSLTKYPSIPTKKTHSISAAVAENTEEGVLTDDDDPMFEVELDEDFGIKNIVEAVEKPSETVIDYQDVIMSEISVERVTSDTCGPDDAGTTHDTTTLADTQAAPEDNSNRTYWKSKLTHILHSTQFCGICLCTDDTVHSLNDQFDIVVCDNTHTTTLADILHVVFRETEDLLSNLILCDSCTNKLIQSYMFIQQAREISKILNCHVQDLYYKSCYIRNSVLKEQEQKESTVQNVLIALENFDTTNSFNTIHTIKQTKKEEKRSMRPKQRRKYKCLRCNLYLPSYKAWMVHEINNHKNQISFKTHMNFSRPNQQALKICKICQRVIQSGGLTEHMKKYHERSTRICSICNITFDSFKALVTHKQEWHYKVDSKCLTCLENYSESELEQHQCRFGCGSCAEVPCVHHKYLMCYREQILNGALRPKCLDCLYVCRTKEALLKHVNMCHLKHRPKAAPR